jgi:hypothetical protein
MTQSQPRPPASLIKALKNGTAKRVGDLTAADTQRLPKLSEQNLMIQQLKRLDLPDRLLVFALIESLADKQALQMEYQRDVREETA